MAFKTLGEVLKNGNEGNLITLRTTSAILRRGAAGKRELIVHVSDEMGVITSSRERREHFKTADNKWLKQQLSNWQKGIPVSVATNEHPLEVITGDACPLLVINEEEYISSILRDIPPCGWLLPGGCPTNFEELLHPDRVALREAKEELLITDSTAFAYSFCTNDKLVRENFAAIGVKLAEINMLSVERPVPPMGDADELVIVHGGAVVRTSIPVLIDPEIASTVATLYLRLHIPVRNLEELRLFDGEVLSDGTPLKRPVRLLKKDGSFAALYLNGNYVPLTDGWITETTGRQSALR